MSPIDDALREELSALLDGALPEGRAAELRQRLQSDDALRREYESLRRAVQAVRALPRRPAPPELRVRLDAAIAGRPPRGAVFRFGMLAAAASVVLGLGLAYFLRGGESRSYEATEPVRERELLDRSEESLRRVEPDGAGNEEAARAAEPAGLRAPLTESRAPQAHAEVLEETPGGPAGGKVQEPEREDEGLPIGRPAPEAPAAEDAAKKRANGSAPGATRQLAADERSGAPKEADLLRTVESQRRLALGDREVYLRLLGALDAPKARQHVLSVFPAGEPWDAGRRAEGKALEREAAAPPLLASITLTDREEANLVMRVLGAAPAPDPASGNTAVFFAKAAKDQVATEVEGTPDELQRMRRWLALIDLDRAASPAADAFVFGAKAKEADQPKKVRAVVRLKYRPAPEPATAPPPGGK